MALVGGGAWAVRRRVAESKALLNIDASIRDTSSGRVVEVAVTIKNAGPIEFTCPDPSRNIERSHVKCAMLSGPVLSAVGGTGRGIQWTELPSKLEVLFTSNGDEDVRVRPGELVASPAAFVVDGDIEGVKIDAYVRTERRRSILKDEIRFFEGSRIVFRGESD